jgi:hypothetical protein
MNLKRLLLAIVVFFLSYFVILAIWLQVKPYYGAMLARWGTYPAAWTAGFKVRQIAHDHETATIELSRTGMSAKGIAELVVDIKMGVSAYSFNVPLTLALALAILPLVNWPRQAFLEACLILLTIHWLYVYTNAILELYKQRTNAGMQPVGPWFQLVLQFAWSFTDNMIIRFEPFLVAVYLYLRKPANQKATQPKRSRKKKRK